MDTALKTAPPERFGRSAEAIRLLIVDDSSVARAVLTRMIKAHDDLEVVATAGNAADAIETLRQVEVDIVLLDVEMPGASGIEALSQIIAAGKGARVLIVSTLAEEGAAVTLRALALGAADTLPKPGSSSITGRFADVLAERLRRIGKVTRNIAPTPQPAQPIELRDVPEWTVDCIAIGASTGGIHAINEFLRALPPVGVPILVTQHLPPIFMPFFAQQLAASSGRAARVVDNGDTLTPDVIHVAPGTAHLALERRAGRPLVKLDNRPAASGCMPSVDPMLASVGDVYGNGATGVVLSGMGRDGLIGAGHLARQGGALFAQDSFSSAIWGMPRAVAEAGLASGVLAPRDIARRIAARVGA